MRVIVLILILFLNLPNAHSQPSRSAPGITKLTCAAVLSLAATCFGCATQPKNEIEFLQKISALEKENHVFGDAATKDLEETLRDLLNLYILEAEAAFSRGDPKSVKLARQNYFKVLSMNKYRAVPYLYSDKAIAGLKEIKKRFPRNAKITRTFLLPEALNPENKNYPGTRFLFLDRYIPDSVSLQWKEFVDYIESTSDQKSEGMIYELEVRLEQTLIGYVFEATGFAYIPPSVYDDFVQKTSNWDLTVEKEQ